MTERGKYVVVEGPDGTGKSTQIELLKEHLSEIGVPSIEIHEPDGVPAAAELRNIIKNGSLERDPWTNVMLFTAARRLNWLQAMQPALEAGTWVLAARSWISTEIYQGNGEGVDLTKIAEFTRNNVGEQYLTPDLTLILALQGLEARKTRIAQRGELDNPDTFESMPDEFQERLEDGYTNFAIRNGIDTIDASQSREQVQADIWNKVHALLP
ncbi:dTMP kinase [Candidatus Saccharibacteria bacterium]|nr:dTMP kinase [Candidatus Saccharibacteria bacterium]